MKEKRRKERERERKSIIGTMSLLQSEVTRQAKYAQ
jgi:hypothetical protein